MKIRPQRKNGNQITVLGSSSVGQANEFSDYCTSADSVGKGTLNNCIVFIAMISLLLPLPLAKD